MKSNCFKTKLGYITIKVTDIGLKEVSFKKSVFKDESLLINSAKKQIINYLDGNLKEFDLPLDVKESSFSKGVFMELKKIGYGEKLSYKDLAIKLNKPDHYRAVAMVMKSNKLPLIRPCHRVTSKNGLGGYNQSINLKKELLDLELVNI